MKRLEGVAFEELPGVQMLRSQVRKAIESYLPVEEGQLHIELVRGEAILTIRRFQRRCCLVCNARMVIDVAKEGRIKQYCSGACRAKAYRARKKEREKE